MAAETPLFILHVIGFAGFLWLGLYVFARGQRGSIAALTCLASCATCLFFLYGAILMSLHDGPADLWLAIDRLGWACDVLPIALWLHLSIRLNPDAAHASWPRAVLWLNYVAAASLVFLGSATNLVRHYIALRDDPSGPLYALYTAYLLICTGFAVVNLTQMLRSVGNPARDTAATNGSTPQSSMAPAGPTPADELPAMPSLQAPMGATPTNDLRDTPYRSPDVPTRAASSVEVRLLVVGALCFLVGSGYESLRELLHTTWSEIGAFLLLLAGLGAVAAAVAVRSALLLGTDVRRDFLYSVTGLTVLIAPFLIITGALTGFDDARRRLFAIAIAALITAGHTLYDQARAWLDAAFFPAPVREERAAARAYAEALATAPAGPSPELATRKLFDDAVRRALTHLSDPTKLATSPLLSLEAVARAVADQALGDDRLARAAALKEILLERLDALKPAEGSAGPAAEAARFYNCLYYPYVRGLSRRRAPTVARQLRERRARDGGPRPDLERVADWLAQVDEDTFYKWQRRASDTIAAALRERERALGAPVPDEITRSAVIESIDDIGQSAVVTV